MSKWYDIKARAGKNSAEVFIYGDIGESWFGESVTAADFVKEIAALDVDALTVRINSYGGSVTDGLAIYNALKRHKAGVTVSIDGIAASIASLIAMAGDTVEMAENASLMIHAPWGGVMGNAQVMREYADVLDKMALAMAGAYVAKSGLDESEVMNLLTDGRDHWYSAAEALEIGFVDQTTAALAIAASANPEITQHGFWAARAQRAAPLSAAMQPRFAIGERIAIVNPHEPEHAAGEIVLVSAEPVYGVAVDGMEAMGMHRWYTDSEIAAESAPESDDPAMTMRAAIRQLPAAAAAQPEPKGQDMSALNTPAAAPDQAAIEASIQARNKALIDTGKAYAKFGGEDLAMQAVAEGWTEDQLNAALLKAANKGEAHATYGSGARTESNLDAKTHGFKSFGEYAFHVRNAAQGTGRIDQRLMAAATTYGNEDAGPDGGFAVPPQFAADIASLALEEQSLLAMADDTPVSGNSMTFPKDETTPWGSTGVIASWDGEGDTASQKKPVLGKSRLELHKLRVLVPATDELLADAPAMTAHLTKKMAEAVLWKSNDAIINGTGAGMPLGILTAASLVAQAKETSQTADTINANNVAKMYGRCIKGAGARLAWLINPDAFNQLITMTIGNQPIYTAPNEGIKGAPDGLLLGRPVIFTDACDTLGDQGDIILANMAGYRAITKAGGAEFSQSMHLWFDQDVQAFKLVFRMDGQPALASAVTPPNSSVTRSHFVALAARA